MPKVRMNGSKLKITPPDDFLLDRDACSYGYFLLAPNFWDISDGSLYRSLDVSGGPVLVRIDQRGGAGAVLLVHCSRRLERSEHAEVRRLVARMLRLDEDASAVRAFHAVDPRWKASGRGRLFRSPTFFEDVIKTVTSCNVAWPNTTTMNLNLCRVLGKPVAGIPGWRTFPTDRRLARAREGTLRARCRVGYRAGRIIELAKLSAAGRLTEAELNDPSASDDEVFERLLALPGIGPYSAANIMQLLGRYSRVAIDTETHRHGRAVLGLAGTEREVHRLLEAHYNQFGRYRFLSYWFELWDFYEARRGSAEQWDRETTGRTFTAAQLR